MSTPTPTVELDSRFSDPEAASTSWAEAISMLESAELYWLTTIRTDVRPHVTPLIGVWQDGAVHFCTGPQEQKARNLERRQQVALITGTNSWARGMDVVVEGTAVRVTDQTTLQRLADGIEAKYGSVWHFDVGDGVFGAWWSGLSLVTQFIEHRDLKVCRSRQAGIQRPPRRDGRFSKQLITAVDEFTRDARGIGDLERDPELRTHPSPDFHVVDHRDLGRVRARIVTDPTIFPNPTSTGAVSAA